MKQTLGLLIGLALVGVCTSGLIDVDYVECMEDSNSLTTYDGAVIDFKGNCRYLISAGEGFQVWVQKIWIDTLHKSCRVSIITLILGNFKIILKSVVCESECGHGGGGYYIYIYIDGNRMLSPCMMSGLMIWADCENGIFIQTTNHWRFYFNGLIYTIYAPKHIYGGPKKMWGICGDADGNPANDMKTKEGYMVMNHTEEVATALAAIAHSWVEGDPEACETEGEEDLCHIDYEEVVTNPKYCGLMWPKRTDTPYLPCYKYSADKLRWHHQMCVRRVCEADTEEERYRRVCYFLWLYFKYCEDHNIVCGKWWYEHFCAPSCGENMVYKDYVTQCPPTCSNPFSHTSCGLPKKHGCECKPGYILSDNRCVPEDDCGCKDPDTGYYFKIGWFNVSADCKVRRDCKKIDGKSTLIHTTLDDCHHNGVCQLSDGLHRCKCKPGYNGDGIRRCFRPACYASTEYKICGKTTTLSGHHCNYVFTDPFGNRLQVMYTRHSGTLQVKVTAGDQITDFSTEPSATQNIAKHFFYWENGSLKIQTRLCFWCWKYMFGLYQYKCTNLSG